MERFEHLIKALRCKRDDCEGCDLAFFDKDEGWMCRYAAKDDDAAAAIEALQAEQKKTVTQIFGEEQQKWEEYCTGLMNRIRELKAQLEDRTNATELWKDMYLTKHMPQDEKDKIMEYIRNAPIGPIEPVQIEKLPKLGEWKPFDLTYGRSIYSCSVCEQATEVPMCMEKPMYAYCPNCGAKMMEVQE